MSLNEAEETIELRGLSVDLNENAMSLNETEEEKVPDTPSSVDSLHRLHRKLLLLEQKGSASEESLDGSVIDDGYDKPASRREGCNADGGSSVSEDDGRAIEREKERQELEKELEVYRKRVLEFEAKEKVVMLKRSKDGSDRSAFSSASCSNGEEDSDGLSIDLNQEAKEDESFYAHQESTPADEVLNFEDSLADSEGERMAILEQQEGCCRRGWNWIARTKGYKR
nr:myosin-binding protein 2 [Ipomoea batatas]